MPSPEDAAEASHRARRIRRWLAAIDPSDAGVLQCAYTVRDWPVALWDALGRLTGVVVRLACALDRLPEDEHARHIWERARADWLDAECRSAGADRALGRLRREAETRFADAHRAYALRRGPLPWRGDRR
jgi:hypothetical protein